MPVREITLAGLFQYSYNQLMNLGHLNLALKMIQEEYKLSKEQIQLLSSRLMADDKEFEKVWSQFKNRKLGKVDTFRELLSELLS